MDEDIKGGEQREGIGFPGLLLIILLVHYKENRVLLKMGGGVQEALLENILHFSDSSVRMDYLRQTLWINSDSDKVSPSLQYY